SGDDERADFLHVFIDAVHGTDFHARAVLGIDARLRDNVRHPAPPLPMDEFIVRVGPPVVNWTSRLRVFADGDGILCAEGCAMARIVETPPVPDRRFDIAGYDAIDTAALETFPYEYPGRDVAVDIETDEFTAVCPWSGLPDFGTVKIRYLPGGKILELRSLKYYLLSYRNVGIYQEHAVTRMLDDLVTTVEPKWMEISLDYKIRGGIHTVCRVRYPH